MSSPVAKNAPTTSGHGRWPRAGPTRTVPGIVQKNASGWRYSQHAATVSTPLRKKTPNIHDASSAWRQSALRADRQDHGDGTRWPRRSAR